MSKPSLFSRLVTKEGGILAFSLLAATTAVRAQWSETTKITASDAAAFDSFGLAVSISGNRAVVGAYRNDDAGKSSGAAYIYEFSADGNWTETDKLTASDAAEEDWFGWSVSISGDRAIVGAPEKNAAGENAGAAYIYELSTSGNWTETARLTASDAAAGDFFGWSVSISGDKAIVGAHRKDGTTGENSGAAYIYELSTSGNWTETAQLSGSDAAESDRFGYSVSISGDRAIVGEGRSDADGENPGAAYIYERAADGNWTEAAQLNASDGAVGDRFGRSVSISEDRVIVGASGNAAYIYERAADGNWTEAAQLSAVDGTSTAHFAWSVSISGDKAVVGRWGDSEAGVGAGAAYTYERSADGNWTETAKLIAVDAAEDHYFGQSVSISGDSIIVGSHGNKHTGITSGAAHIFLDCPRVKATATSSSVCPGESVTLSGAGATTYLWDRGVQDGVAFIPTATTTYTVTATDVAKGCPNTDEIEVIVGISVVATADKTTVCSGESVTLSGAGATTYRWDKGVYDGVAFAPTATTTYTVTGKDATRGCTGTDELTITVLPLPSADFSADKRLGCPSSLFQLRPVEENAVAYQWDFGDGTSSDLKAAEHAYSDTGRYAVQLTVTSPEGCSASLLQADYLGVQKGPTASFTFSPQELNVMDTHLQLENLSTDYSQVEWRFGDGSPSSSLSDPQHSYPSVVTGNQTYTIQLIATNDIGCLDSSEQSIKVEEDQLIVYVPNAFTPDTDGLNDAFTPQLTSGYRPESYRFVVYNRWGNIVHESTAVNTGWDGTDSRGEAVQGGVYVWQLQFKESMSGKRHRRTGVLTLLR